MLLTIMNFEKLKQDTGVRDIIFIDCPNMMIDGNFHCAWTYADYMNLFVSNTTVYLLEIDFITGKARGFNIK